MTMPAYLLDTCVCIRLLRGGGAPVARRIAAAEPGTIAISAISHAELIDGAARGGAAGLAALEALLEKVPVAAFDSEAARSFPAARLARGRYDRLIAAHAMALGATLVTHNAGDFRKVPGLRIEDWF